MQKVEILLQADFGIQMSAYLLSAWQNYFGKIWKD